MIELINSDPAVLDALVTYDERWIYCYNPDTKRKSSQWMHAGSPRSKKARQSKSAYKLLMIPFFDSTGMIYMHLVTTAQTVTKEYYVEVLREFRRDSVGRGKHSSNRVSGISTRTMHQSTTPSLSQTIWPRWTTRQFLGLPLVQTLLPVTFGYSLSSRKILEVVVIRQLRRWKRLWRRSLTRWQKRTSMGLFRSCWNGTKGAFQL